MVTYCPADVVNSTEPGLDTGIAYWQEPTFNDNVGIVSNGSTHNPGDVFPLGNTTVTYYASDAAGNMMNCSFVVVIEGELTIVI